MGSTTKKITIGGSILVLLGAWTGWFYVKKRNEAEVKALTDYINGSITQNNVSTGSNEIVAAINTLPLTKGNLLIDNIPDSNKAAFQNALANVVVNLYSSMSGAGTDVNLFFTNFYRIKNKATMKFVDALYKSIYGETLFEAIQGESKLYTGTTAKLAVDPFGILAKELPNYNPAIIKWLGLLK